MPVVPAIISLLYAGCTIQKLPDRRPDDGYYSLSNQQRHHLQEADDIQSCCSEVTASDVTMICRKNKLTWITVLASWCPHSKLVEQQLANWRDQVPSGSVGFLQVHLDYDRQRIHDCRLQIRSNENYRVLSRSLYGGKEWEKERCFYEALTGKKLVTPAVPLHLIFDNNAQLLFKQSGTVSDPMELIRQLLDELNG